MRLRIGAFGTAFNLEVSDAADKAASTFRTLALNGSYTGRRFFRVETGFIAQAGCPNDTGLDSMVPLFALSRSDVESTLTGGMPYSRGTIALACSKPFAEYGSQFFVVLSDQPDLPRIYPVVGRFTGNVLQLGRVGIAPLSGGGSAPDPTISSVERLDVAV